MKNKKVIARLQGKIYGAGERIIRDGVAVLVENGNEFVIYEGHYSPYDDRRIPHYRSGSGGNVGAAMMTAAEYAVGKDKKIRFATGAEYQKVKW